MRDFPKFLDGALIFAVLILVPIFVLATDLESSNFKLKDPIIPPAGGYSTSDNFRLIGSVSQIGIGTSSASNFNVSAGFLYFPAVTAPALTATAGDAQVSLSWIASVGVLGWNVSNYSTGRSIFVGGPYTFTSVGNVLSSTVTGLTNATTYYFVVRSEDVFGNPLATSSEVSATPTTSAAPPPSAPHSSGPIGLAFDLITRLIRLVPPGFPEECIPFIPQDLNCDGKVDLLDLSVFLFLSPEPAPNPADFNKDDVVDIQDLSSLFFGWTEQLLTFIPEEPSRGAEELKGKAGAERGRFAFIGEATELEDEEEKDKQIQVETIITAPRRTVDFFIKFFHSMFEVGLQTWNLLKNYLLDWF